MKITQKFAGTYPIKVVCTTGMVADLIQRVGGSHVKIEQLMHAGVDPHQYKVSPGDLTLLSGADIVFYSGLHLEGKMVDTLERLGKKLPTVAVAEYVDPAKILSDADKAHDPHVWFDVSLWSEAGRIVSEAMSQFDPKHAEEYHQNFSRYQAELAKLHQWAHEQLATVPPERRVLVTSHDAFRYFGRAYPIEVKGLQGISTESEASVKDVNDMVRFLCERKVKALFVETSVNPSNMQALLEGCKARGHPLVLGGELFSDAMGPAGTPQGTYVGMIRHNVETIVKALK